MTKEEWDLKQNSLKKSYKYLPTGTPGQVKKIEDTQDTEEDDDIIKRKKKKESTEENKTDNSIDAKPKTKAEKELSKETVSSPQGVFSAIIDSKGKTKKNPSASEALKTHIEYLKHNWSDQSDTPSTNYRPKWQHEAIKYNKKKEQAKQDKV